MKTSFVLLLVFLALFAAPLLSFAQPPTDNYMVFTIKNTNKYSDTTAENIRVTGVYTNDGEVFFEQEITRLVAQYSIPETFDAHMSLIPGSGYPTRIKIYKITGAAPSGASFVVDSNSTDLLLGSFGYDAGAPVEPYPTQIISFNGLALQPDGTKPIWVTTSSALDGALFREGIDKLVGAVGEGAVSGSSSGGSFETLEEKAQTIIDNQNRDSLVRYHAINGSGTTVAADSLTAAATLQAANVVSAFGNASVTRGTGVAAVTPASDSVQLGVFEVVGPFAEQLTAGFKPLAFDGPYSIFAFASGKILSYGLIVREMLLWLTVFSFWYFARDLMEKYYIGFMNTPQMTTKTETAQIAVPGVGWGKQLVTVLTIYTVLLVAIGGTIAAMNTGLGNIFAGQTLADTSAGLINIYSALSGSFVGDTVLPFFERFVPLAAMVECAVAQMVLSFGMPIVWAACMTIAKVFHL